MVMDIILKWIPLAIILSTSGFFIYMNYLSGKERKNRSKDRDYTAGAEDAQTDYSRLIRLYEVLSKFPLTSKGTNQLHELLAGLGVYTIVEQRVEAARLIITSYVILMVSVVIISFISQEIIVQVGSVLLALIFRRDFINKKLRKERIEMWEDTYRSFASLKNEWERVYSLQKAFNKTVVEDKSKMLFASVTNLFKTTQPSADLALFNQNNPNQIMQRFADLCYNTYYYGVETSKSTGVDTFLSNLDVIMKDLLFEIDLAKEEKKKFYVAEKLPIVCMGIVAFAPGFLTARYPGIHYFQSSAFGMISAIVSVAAIAIVYHYCANINDSDRPVDDTFDFEVYFFMKPKFKDFWKRRVPNWNMDVVDLLRDSLSYLTQEQVKFRQVYLSLLAGLITFILTILYVVFSAQSHLVNLAQAPAEVMDIIEQKYSSPDEFATKFVLDDSIDTPEKMSEALAAEGLNLNPTSLEVMTNILVENKEKYYNATYKPYYIFIIILVMFVVGFVPKILLKRRAKLVNVEVEFEVLVLYAITVQMMYLPLKLRDYLKRFTYLSKLYPKTHLDCWINQFNNPIFIKDKAKEMNNSHYYDLMERLYTLHSARIPQEIFREIERKREYMFNQVVKKRELKQYNNYKILSMCVIGVMILVMTLQVIVPIGYFSLQAFSQYSGFM